MNPVSPIVSRPMVVSATSVNRGRRPGRRRCALLAACAAAVLLPASVRAAETAAALQVRVEAAGKAISPDLFGIFFEDINWAADGGLYAELIQNRSFEYAATERREWNNFTAWQTVERGSSKGWVGVRDAFPLHANNPHYVLVATNQAGEGQGLRNSGFDGIPVTEGESYRVSLFARQHYIGDRWRGGPERRGNLPLVVRLETADGALIAETKFGVAEREWRPYSAELVATKTDRAAVLVVLATEQGGIALDEISLMPVKTFRNRRNGLRADLAQAIADLKPRFIRFPGGCLVHGNGLGNMYRWKDTIGPIEQRKQQPNIWGYHQTMGLGYFEYFQFCEDIGAKPLPVVAAGVCCQNSGDGIGQAGLPLEAMPAYLQEVLDLIEWANGPVTSEWGARRAAAGHPEPFGLEYLGVGNEDKITPEFETRFRMIHDAIKAKHPEIKVIGTSGPFANGEDFDAGWKLAHATGVPIVDEHYYVSPDWFWKNLTRYDSYDRKKSKVYLGEYAAHGPGRKMELRWALAEAAGLTALERNGDIVVLSSYAPLLARIGHTQWNPDLIYFDATAVYPSVNYYVQQLFSTNAGDIALGSSVPPVEAGAAADFAFSAVKDRASGDVILKLVNGADRARAVRVDLSALRTAPGSAKRIVLTGDPTAINHAATPRAVVPQESAVTVGPAYEAELPAFSLTVLRFRAEK